MPVTEWELLLEDGNAQIRQCRTAVFHSLCRADDNLLISQHAQGVPSRSAAALHLENSPGAVMTGMYRAEFERIWVQAPPLR